MSGLLGCCGSPFFTMEADVFYASESQDKYGAIEKKWNYYDSITCTFYTRDDDTNNNNFDYDDKKFYRLETRLFGRTNRDIRKSSSGMLYPLSHILVTSIRPAGTEDVYFYETNGDYVGKPTVFDIKMVQPYIGPFGSVEYFKVQLERSDTQGLSNCVAC